MSKSPPRLAANRLSMADYLRQTNQSYRQALDSLSYAVLQAEAKEVGVKANGKRDELVARLWTKYVETMEANMADSAPECDSDPSPAELVSREDAEWRDFVHSTDDSAPPAGSECRKVEERAAELDESLSVLVLTAADSRTAHDWFPSALASLLLQWRDWDAPAVLSLCRRLTGERIDCPYAAECALGTWANDEYAECVRAAL